MTDTVAVKFDTAKLPAILNSLETQNNNQKLVLEVAVRNVPEESGLSSGIDNSLSNISVRMSSAALPWTVCHLNCAQPKSQVQY